MRQEVNKLVKQAQARGSKSILSVHISDMQKDENEISDREVNQLNAMQEILYTKSL